MSPEEYNKMVETKQLQVRSGGLTHVLLQGKESFMKQAPKGSYYVEFDIPSGCTITRGSGIGWGTFYSLETSIGKLNAKRGLDVTQPKVKNIEIVDVKK
jgi:hypothetical protein